MYSLPILELLQDCEDPPATPESLEELEIELGVRFPKQYADFLLQFNGGNFKRPVAFDVHNPTDFLSSVLFHGFLGDPLDHRAGGYIAKYADMLSGRIPDDCLAIAHCNGNDLVMLQVAGPVAERGRIWFWDGVDECEGNNIHWLADSFVEFLPMLYYDREAADAERESNPIFVAIENNRQREVERFLAGGGKVETRNRKGLTLLATAARYSWPKLVRLLLDHSADPNARDRRGRTPLHHAATASIDSLKLLLAAGAKARDRKGQSVLADWSYRANQILRTHGAED